jgi:hypothetical protein
MDLSRHVYGNRALQLLDSTLSNPHSRNTEHQNTSAWNEKIGSHFACPDLELIIIGQCTVQDTWFDFQRSHISHCCSAPCMHARGRSH